MRNYRYTYFLFISLFFCQTLFAQGTNNINTDQIIQQKISNFMTQNKVPGVAVGIYFNGQDHFYNAGVANKSTNQPITKDTIFELASVGKTFTATLLGICVEQKICHLNDPVIKFLPQIANNKSTTISKVTLQELATHTSSLPRTVQELGVTDLQASNANDILMQKLIAWQPDYPVGTHYLYSNIGFGLLGKAVSNALGGDYKQSFNQYILKPLNMNNTFVNVPSDQFNHFAQGYNKKNNPAEHYPPTPWPGGGSISSTPSDMLQFLKAIMGIGNNIPPQLTAAMNLTLKGYFPVKSNFTQGLAWQRMTKNNTLIITKNGMNKGFNTFVAILPQQKIAIVVLTNKRGCKPGKLTNQILQGLT